MNPHLFNKNYYHRIFQIMVLIMMVFSASMAQSDNTVTLQEAIDYALDNTNAIKLKQIDIASASADIKEFKSIGMPKVSGSVNYQYYFFTPAQPVADFITPSVYEVLFDEEVLNRRELGPPEVFEFSLFQPHQLTGGIEASALLFDGSYLIGLKAAKLYKELVAKEMTATEQEIKSNVTKAYMAVLIAEENRSVISNNIRTVSKSLEEIKALYEEGFAESLDVDRLTLSYNNLYTELEKLEGLIEISKNLLKFQMGYPIEENIVLTEDLEVIVGNYKTENIVLEESIDYTKRAEYDVINTGQELNKLDLKRNKAGYLPAVRVFANAQEALQRQNLFDGNESGWLPTLAAGVGINIPIYDGGEKSAKIQKVKLNIEKTDIQMDEFKRSVNLQVYNAKLALFNAKKNVANTQTALSINERIYNKTQIKFREGVGSSVEVTQAEASFYEAQGAYINALYDLVTAKTDLDIALGAL
jgi:outer membrane protein TolC